MKRVVPWIAFLLCLSTAPARGQAAAPSSEFERRLVCGPDSARQWSAAESAVESTPAPGTPDRAALHWHVTVDYNTGESRYPIGWPRAHWSLTDPAARDWSQWDFLQLRVWTDTSRQSLPAEPVGLALYTPDKASAYQRPLAELQKGQWVDIRIPLAQVPRAHDVRLMQIHISESKYRDQDQLDLYFDEISLLRYAEPFLADFTAESAVMFADVKFIPIRFQLLGVKSEAVMEIDCQLRRDGQVAANATVRGTRGPQRVVLDVSRQPLAAGMYELVARVAGGRRQAAAPVRLVESPWK
jgi:hypothetical protein